MDKTDSTAATSADEVPVPSKRSTGTLLVVPVVPREVAWTGLLPDKLGDPQPVETIKMRNVPIKTTNKGNMPFGDSTQRTGDLLRNGTVRYLFHMARGYLGLPGSKAESSDSDWKRKDTMVQDKDTLVHVLLLNRDRFRDKSRNDLTP